MPQVILGLGVIGLWVAAVIGWIMNIFTLYHMSFETMTGELVVRIIGIFVAPIGAIMGYV